MTVVALSHTRVGIFVKVRPPEGLEAPLRRLVELLLDRCRAGGVGMLRLIAGVQVVRIALQPIGHARLRCKSGTTLGSLGLWARGMHPKRSTAQ